MPLFTPRSWLLAVSYGVLTLLPSVASEGKRLSDMRYFRQHKSFVEEGDRLSTYTVGLCYCGGIGVARDSVEAYAYWSLRETRDQEEARWARYLLEKEISPETKRLGEVRARTLQQELDAKVASYGVGKKLAL